ncbi:hypothetical protein GUJ93_ZPchr0005g15794 [Zizania palustris]|uniref:Disease resistance R13L4/SHOC-2-like LRR domain-containing protein n=1 Tax=Zizania palustris TaxID=103762 RepID=A0A8J5W0F3_ZIZPA|nr:hypothetical protein GUJ93_ZPchr0005g15794 [Zizania palustris]
MQPRRRCVGGVSGQLVWVVLVWSWRMLVEAQQAPKTDPIEVAALNAIFARWGLTASPQWNISGEPCSGFASDGIDWDNRPNITPFIKCDCSYNTNTVCHITRLRLRELNVIGQIPSELQNLTYLVDLDMGRNYLTGAIPSFIGTFSRMQYLSLGSSALSGPLPKELGNLTNLISLRVSDNEFTGKIPDYLGSLPNLVELAFHGNSFEGPIPESLSNLTKLTTLRLGDIVNGSSSLAFISNLASLSLLDLSFNNITGQIPQSLLNLGNIQSLFLGNNSLTGRLPEVISSSLKTIDLSYNQLNGSLPSWATQNNLQFNKYQSKFYTYSKNNGTTERIIQPEKADIFAFGVLMLEIVAGRPNTINSLEESKIYLFEWLWSLYEKAQALGIVDPSLKEFNKDEAFRVICVALLCTQGSPHQRPPMSKVVAMLTGEAEVAEVVAKPSYINEWLLRDGNQSYITCSYTGSTTSDFSTKRENTHLLSQQRSLELDTKEVS